MSQRCGPGSTLKEILDRVLLDSPPTRGEAYQLINAGVEDLPAIVSCASAIRNRKKLFRVGSVNSDPKPKSTSTKI